VALVKQTEFLLLGLHTGFGTQVHQVQLPCLGHAVAIGIGLCKVISRIQKQHRNIGNAATEKIQDHHVLSLKAAGDARARALLRQNGVDHSFRGLTIDLAQQLRDHASPFCNWRRCCSSMANASPSLAVTPASPMKKSLPKTASTSCLLCAAAAET